MITHFEMGSGEVQYSGEHTTGHSPAPARAVQPGLQTVDEARTAEPETAVVMPAGLLAVPVEHILARFS